MANWRITGRWRGRDWLSVFVIVFACASPTDKSANTSDKGAGTDSEGEGSSDFETSSPVPMGLLDGHFLATISTNLGGTGGADPGARPTSAPSDADSSSAYALGIINAPVHALAGIRLIYSSTRALQDAIFGSNGFFQGMPVNPRKDGMPRYFDLGAGMDPRFVSVAVNPTSAPYRFAVKLYSPNADGTFAEVADFELTSYGPGGNLAKVRIQRAASTQGSAGGQVVQRLDAEYDTGVQQIAGTYGTDPVVPRGPERTYVGLDLTASGMYTLSVAYIWGSGIAALSANDGVRYHDLLPGDVETAVVIGALDDAAQGRAQRMGFIPVDTGGAPASFADLMESAMTGAVRSMASDPECAAAGTAINGGLVGAGKNSPNLPPNVCQTNQALGDAAVLAAVSASCAAGVNIQLPKTSLCAWEQERLALTNPVLIYAKDGAATVVLPPDSGPASLGPLRQAVLNQSFAPIDSLKSAWPETQARPAADFAGAALKP